MPCMVRMLCFVTHEPELGRSPADYQQHPPVSVQTDQCRSCHSIHTLMYYHASHSMHWSHLSLAPINTHTPINIAPLLLGQYTDFALELTTMRAAYIYYYYNYYYRVFVSLHSDLHFLQKHKVITKQTVERDKNSCAGVFYRDPVFWWHGSRLPVVTRAHERWVGPTTSVKIRSAWQASSCDHLADENCAFN